MLTNSDKAWVAGLVTFLGQLAAAKFGLPMLSPELIALLTGAAVWWMPNRQGSPRVELPPKD